MPARWRGCTRQCPRRGVLVEFFEDMVSGDAAARICAFLGIAPHPALARVVHGGAPLR